MPRSWFVAQRELEEAMHRTPKHITVVQAEIDRSVARVVDLADTAEQFRTQFLLTKALSTWLKNCQQQTKAAICIQRNMRQLWQRKFHVMLRLVLSPSIGVKSFVINRDTPPAVKEFCEIEDTEEEKAALIILNFPRQ